MESISIETLSMGLLWYVVFIFTITVHEAAHAFAAYRLGDLTAYEGGQVTLDPRPHIEREPIGTIVVPIISYLFSGWMMGWASAPYDYYWAQRYPKRSALMALAGPMSNLFLAVVAVIIIRIGFSLEIFEAPNQINFSQITIATEPGVYSAIASLVSILFSLNLILCIFNLLPIPPLDGSGIAPLYLTANAAQKYMDFVNKPNLRLVGLILAWQIMNFIFSPIHLFCINLIYPGVSYH